MLERGDKATFVNEISVRGITSNFIGVEQYELVISTLESC